MMWIKILSGSGQTHEGISSSADTESACPSAECPCPLGHSSRRWYKQCKLPGCSVDPVVCKGSNLLVKEAA